MQKGGRPYLPGVAVVSSECTPHHHVGTELDTFSLFKCSSGDRCQESCQIQCKHCPFTICAAVWNLYVTLGALQHDT